MAEAQGRENIEELAPARRKAKEYLIRLQYLVRSTTTYRCKKTNQRRKAIVETTKVKRLKVIFNRIAPGLTKNQQDRYTARILVAAMEDEIRIIKRDLTMRTVRLRI